MIATETRPLGIYQYTPTQDRGDVLYQAWRMVEESGDGPALFWNVSGWTGDLPAFCRYMTTEDRQLFLLHTEQDVVGLAWAEDIRPGHHAFFSFFMRPAYRGAMSFTACRQMSQSIMAVYDLPRLWAMTPWRHAKLLARQAGFQEVATVPQYAQVQGQAQDVWLLSLTR